MTRLFQTFPTSTFVIVVAAWALVSNARQSAIAAATQANATRSRPAQLIR
ncbi:hypothetical protein [Parolsenella catena]